MAMTVMFQQRMMQVLLLLSCNDLLKFDWSCQLSGGRSNSNNLWPGNKINFYQSECHVTDCAVGQSDQNGLFKASFCSCREHPLFSYNASTSFSGRCSTGK